MTIEDLRPVSDEWSVADLDRFPPTIRAEVHDGRLVIMSPARLWRQHVQALLRNLLVGRGRPAFTEVGILRTQRDTRVADIAVFRDEPEDPDTAWQRPYAIALVVEVWSPWSDGKDRAADGYAEVGTPTYWLAEPIDGQKWGALVTMYELARTPGGTAAYIETRKATLAELESGRFDLH